MEHAGKCLWEREVIGPGAGNEYPVRHAFSFGGQGARYANGAPFVPHLIAGIAAAAQPGRRINAAEIKEQHR